MVVVDDPHNNVSMISSLSQREDHKADGGLRTKGCFKRSFQDKPLITVITVVFNGEKTIEATIKSVINQTYDNIEYIVIDGSSTDRTIDILKQYEDYIDYWISESDNGIYDAMNKGVSFAKGDWLYFLGSDDLILNIVNKMVEYFKCETGIYYGDVYMPGRHKLFDGKFGEYKLMFTNICQQAIFYPRRVFTKYLYDTKYEILADHAFNLNCHGDKEYKLIYVPQLICVYNDISGISSSSNDTDWAFEEDRQYLVKKNFTMAWYLLYYVRIRIRIKFLKSYFANLFKRL